MGDELEQENKSRSQDPVEYEEQPPEEKDIEKNPDLEDPRLYSPLLGSTSPVLKERIGEEHSETLADQEHGTEEQPEASSDEQHPGEKTGSAAVDRDEPEPDNNTV